VLPAATDATFAQAAEFVGEVSVEAA